MAVKVRCTGCQKVLNAPDQARGKAIKCPNCETRISVPATDDAAPAKKEKKKAAAAVSPDSESALATLDLRNAEDQDARICPKCGYDMTHYDEEQTECPKCGHDMATGGLGEKARKKRMKGPDPDKFYAGMWKGCWKFVGVNRGLAFRTIMYTLLASTMMFGCIFAYLYFSPWPPRMFFALCAAVSGLMIPGWLWFLDEQVVANTLMKKDKLKRINLDFFLCSALGVKAIVWHLVFAGPLLAIPALIGWALVSFGGLPTFVLPIVVGVCYLPVLSMLPIVIGHMVMPVQAPGWMFWKVFPAWLRVLKPCFLWLMMLLFTQLPAIGCVAAIAAVYGPTLNQIAVTMDHNSAIARAKADDENKGAKDKTKGQDPLLKETPAAVNFFPLIVPGVLWVVACLTMGFPALYAMRLNGQLVYYFRDSLDMIALAKEYKYVARAVKDEDEEAKPKTFGQILFESTIITVVCIVIGTVGGMVYGAMSQLGMMAGMGQGVLYGTLFAMVIGRLALLNAAFQEGTEWGLLVWWLPFGDLIFVITHWDEGKAGCLTQVFATLAFVIELLVYIVLLVSGIVKPPDDSGGFEPVDQNQVAPDMQGNDFDGDGQPDIMPANPAAPAGEAAGAPAAAALVVPAPDATLAASRSTLLRENRRRIVIGREAASDMSRLLSA